MSESDKKASFDVVLQEALKIMRQTATNTSSSSYQVLRSSGAVIVQRPEKDLFGSEIVTPPLKKVG